MIDKNKIPMMRANIKKSFLNDPESEILEWIKWVENRRHSNESLKNLVFPDEEFSIEFNKILVELEIKDLEIEKLKFDLEELRKSKYDLKSQLEINNLKKVLEDARIVSEQQKKDYEQKLLELENQLKQEKTVFEEYKFAASEFLIKEFNLDADLVNEDFDYILKIIKEIKKIKTPKVEAETEVVDEEDDSNDSENNYPNQDVLYDPQLHKCLFCGGRKRGDAFQCDKCAKRIELIRVTKGISRPEARRLFGLEKGINPGDLG